MTELTSQRRSLDYELSEMTARDLEQVVKIENSCFSNPWPQDCFRYDIRNPNALTLVARAGETVFGYLVGYLVQQELQIANIAVRPQYRRLGIGRRLLSEAISRAKDFGCRHACLDVRASNSTAIRLYKSMGFEVVGQRLGYYAAPYENALIMGRSLGRESSHGVVQER